MSGQSRTKGRTGQGQGHVESKTSLSWNKASASGKASYAHAQVRDGNGSHDVFYAKGKAEAKPYFEINKGKDAIKSADYTKCKPSVGVKATAGGKACMVKVRENIGGARVHVEGPSATAKVEGRADSFTGLYGKATAGAGLAKCKVKAGPAAAYLGLSVDSDISGQLWPPQAGAHLFGTGVKVGWDKLEASCLGSGVSLKNPFTYDYWGET